MTLQTLHDTDSRSDALVNDDVPTIVVASNCDHSPRSWRVEYENIERICKKFPGIECFKTDIGVPETHKRCVSIILRNIMQERHGK